MEKRIIIVGIILSFVSLMGRTQPFVQPVDTLEGRVEGCYYYPFWYDECPQFQRDTVAFTMYGRPVYPSSFDVGILRVADATEHYAPQPLRVKGALVMVRLSMEYPWPMIDSLTRAPELVVISQGDTLFPDSLWPSYYYPRHMEAVDSSRWDTAAAHLLKLPKNIFASPSGPDSLYFQCFAYKAYFPQPVTVHDTFYLVGTYRSNSGNSNLDYYHYPTNYARILNMGTECDRCEDTRVFRGGYPMGDPIGWLIASYDLPTFGPFIPIVEQYDLVVTAGRGGSVSGGGHIPAGWTVEVSATAQPGYVFSRWSDGVTDNPRSVTVDGDLSLEAWFSIAK